MVRGARRYRRVLIIVFVALAAATVGLTIANAERGPRLETVQFDPQSLVSSNEQTVVFVANQPLDDIDASQVSVEPPSTFDVTVTDNTLVLQFDTALRNNDEYSIAVEGVTGMQTRGSSTFEAEIATPDLDVLTLVKDPEGDDTITRSSLGSGESSVVFSAPRILEYVEIGTVLAVLTEDADGASSIVVHKPNGDDITIPIPSNATALELHSSTTANMFGYLLRKSDGTADSIALYDLAGTSGEAFELVGADGLPLSALDWTFVPGSSSLVYQALDQALVLVDPLGSHPAIPLGQHAELRRFIPGTQTLIVADPTHGSTIDLLTGETATIEAPQPQDDPRLYSDDLLVLASDTDAPSFVETFVRRDDVTYDQIGSLVVYSDATTTRTLYESDDDALSVERICASPNGQYIAIALSDSPADGEQGAAPFSARGEVLVTDTTDDTVDITIDGLLPSWCN
ncbi:hypothetical protein GCM10027416_28050 [Okibacterium endophyticum]